MGTDPLLTVAIPTFDRNEILKANLAKLLPQLTPDCTLLILDNHSPTPLADTLADLLSQYPNVRVDIVRHRVNIGGNANIVRCFELCETKWMWLLGDDDEPFPDAIAQVLTAIADRPNSACINFTCGPTKRSRYRDAIGVDDAVNAIDFLGFFTWISTNAYNIPAILPYCGYGLTYAYSSFPHFAIVLHSLSHGGTLTLSNRPIVRWDMPPPRFRYSSVFRGAYTLLTIPMSRSARRQLSLKLKAQGATSFVPMFSAFLHEGLADGDIPTAIAGFNRAALNYLVSPGRQYHWLTYVLFRSLLLFPQLAKWTEHSARRLCGSAPYAYAPTIEL